MSEILQLIVLSALACAVVLFVVLTFWTPQVVEWSVRLYRLLLAAYPIAFRNEYGEAMVQLFRDTARDAYRRRGLLGLAAVWLRTLADFTVSVIRQHRDNPVKVSSESVLLRDLLQKWRRLGFEALSVTAFSVWYFLHHFWAILTVLALATWFGSFFDSVDLVRGGGETTVGLVGGLVEIRHRYDRSQPIPQERFFREARERMNQNPTEAIEFNERLNKYPWPWEFSFISDISGGRGIGVGPFGKVKLVQPCKSWRLCFHFGFFPVLLLLWTIRVYRQRKAGPATAIQSA